MSVIPALRKLEAEAGVLVLQDQPGPQGEQQTLTKTGAETNNLSTGNRARIPETSPMPGDHDR
jgi:hypothetical protein